MLSYRRMPHADTQLVRSVVVNLNASGLTGGEPRELWGAGQGTEGTSPFNQRCICNNLKHTPRQPVPWTACHQPPVWNEVPQAEIWCCFSLFLGTQKKSGASWGWQKTGIYMPFLPLSWKWNMQSWKMTLVSKGGHFPLPWLQEKYI